MKATRASVDLKTLLLVGTALVAILMAGMPAV